MAFALYAALAVFGLLFVGWGLLAGDIDGDAIDDTHQSGLWALFSLRTVAFGALAFGATGVLGRLAGWSAPVTLALAGALGAGTWIGVGTLFAYLQKSQSGQPLTDASWIGSEARLVLPFGRDGIGRITLTAGGQITELAAKRADAHAEMPAEAFARCAIDRIEDGTAIIIPLSLSASD
jgi:hypothetical protein